MRGFALSVGIIAAIGLGALLFRDVLSGNASSLAVGDCFDEPATQTETVPDVQHHRCTDLHDAEVFYVGNYEPASDSYPSDPQFLDFIRDRCTDAFDAYTGLDYTKAQDLDFLAYKPTADGWAKGNRKVICYAVKVDASQLNASIKKAG